MNVRLDELDSQEEEEEEEDDDEDEDEEDEEEEGIVVEFHPEDLLEDALENEEVSCEMADKETNTECVFIPEKGIAAQRRRRVTGDEEASAVAACRAIVIKRSQTFSPSARTQYTCRVSFYFGFKIILEININLY